MLHYLTHLMINIMEDNNERQTIELATILQEGIEAYKQQYKLSDEQERAVKDIINCRTKELGGHIKKCDNCGFSQQSYNSCRNRHCPKCQFAKQEQWVDKLTHNLLPCKYYHVVFTLPKELQRVIYLNPKICYSLLFKASSQALLKAAYNPDFLGAQSGAVAILHTWTQTLCFHPHIHMLVPAGGLSDDGMEWKDSRKKYFLPGKALSRIYRGIMIRLIEEALEKKQIKLPSTYSCFSQLKDQLYQKEWNVYLKKPFGGVNSVLKYLGRYTHRVAISNSRIISHSANSVSFWYKDNKKGGKRKIMTLETNEFIRRYLHHILPGNFYKIRYIGILAIVNSKTKRVQCIALLDAQTYLPVMEGLNAMEIVEIIRQTDPFLCPKCKKGKMSNRIRDVA